MLLRIFNFELELLLSSETCLWDAESSMTSTLQIPRNILLNRCNQISICYLCLYVLYCICTVCICTTSRAKRGQSEHITLNLCILGKKKPYNFGRLWAHVKNPKKVCHIGDGISNVAQKIDYNILRLLIKLLFCHIYTIKLYITEFSASEKFFSCSFGRLQETLC